MYSIRRVQESFREARDLSGEELEKAFLYVSDSHGNSLAIYHDSLPGERAIGCCFETSSY